MRYLTAVLVGCSIVALPCEVNRNAWPLSDEVINTAEARVRSAACEKVAFTRDTTLAPEEYRIEGTTISASTSRGLLYGAYAFAAGRGAGRSRPRFPIREWWSAAFQANFNLPLGGAFDRPIEEISAVVSRTIREAPLYGINALQLMGRAGEGGIDLSWFLRYDDFPKLRGVSIGWGIERRTEEIRKLAREAHAHGLDFLLWDHELVFPDRMLEAYPEMRGVEYPYCFSHPLVMKFLKAKIDEFFRRLPEVDGLNLTFAETRGYNILEHGGCKCDQCSRISTADKVRRVIVAVHESVRRHGKRLEVRSYNQQPAHAEVMLQALRGLPSDIPVVTKNTVVDFRGTGYPDNPMLAEFPQVLELTATPEGSGYGYLPALPGDFYKRVINRRDLRGVAIRTDYHLQYGHATFFTDGPAVLTFDTPNAFNIFTSSRLAWDPGQSIDTLWKEWTVSRYGAKAAPLVERALRRTAAISQGIFFVKGFSLLTHLNMVPHLDYIDNELDKSYLLQFFPKDPGYRRTYETLKHPSEETIREILAEKKAAAAAAKLSLKDVEQAREYLDSARYQELSAGLKTAENAALLWERIAEVYFRLRKDKGEPLAAAIRSLVAESCRIERQAGRRWPVYPAARGTTALQFAQEALERGQLCCVQLASCQ